MMTLASFLMKIINCTVVQRNLLLEAMTINPLA